METKKSIQDIRPSNSSNQKTVSDIITVDKPIKRRIRKNNNNEGHINTEDETTSYTSSPAENDNYEVDNVIKPKKTKLKKIMNIIKEIKPFYLITFLIIIIGLIVLIFIPSTPKDPTLQAKKEAEMVKKELSKHMILPKDDEQIDIRKITSKMNDPFFKDAEIGDYLIIFYKNRIAHIYSIDKDIIINTGVVFIDPKTATTTKQ